MSTTRVIKKYPNRRLYDTEESHYITLADIRDLVIKRIDFTVIDKKSGDDITRSILLQVISEQEAHGEAIMSKDFLSQVIRAYDTVKPSLMGRYLEQSVALFVSQEHVFRGQVKRLVEVDPVEVDPLALIADMTQKNLARFRPLQEEIFDRFVGNTGAAPAAGDANTTAADPAAEKPEGRAKTSD